jgi:uncharacterized ion transporter superfamily protein YfcC
MKNYKFPNALTIVVFFIIAAGILTYIIPKGKYERVIDPDSKREVVVPGSYQKAEASQLSPFDILVCIPRGIIQGGEVLVLVFLVGGCLYIVEKTGALKEGISYFASIVKGKEELALVLIGFLFVVGGAVEGLEEEIIPMIPVLLVFTRNLGYSPIVTVAVSYGSANIGAAFSPANPFGAVIAQKVADVSFLTNSVFRVIVLLIAFIIWIAMLIHYAKKNKTKVETQSISTLVQFSKSHILILIFVVIAFSLLIYGMLFLDWSFNQISAEFFVIGICVGLIGRLGINGTFSAYAEGLQQMTFASMIGGFAYSIPLILKEGMIIDSIIYGLFTPLQYVSPVLSILGMMVSQSLLHFVIPSYSGQAILTMPILAPLSDLIGISRDVCVMAYQYGAILMNLVSPTNGAMMAIITIAGISYKDWLGFILKRLLVIYVVCAVVLIVMIVGGI